MGASRATGIVEDSRFDAHRGPPGHPERPERLQAVREAVAERADRLETLPSRRAEAEEILRVHGRAHLDRVEEAVRQAPGHLDADTYVAPESLDVALRAAGASIDLARAVATGGIATGLAAVRPPGHHAETDHAMGFCLFNNIALAARALQDRDGVERLLILDWDVHHGNGTQHFFEEDPNVLFVSLHQFPFYPGTGAASEAGRGRGEGATLNVPLPAGCGDEEYDGAMQRLVVPAARHFRPEMILVSSGFDAHHDDRISAMHVSAAGFAALARSVRALADDLCGGRLACVLEGGYARSGLREGTGALLDALLDPDPAPLPAAPPPPTGSVLRQVIASVAGVHGGRIPDLGAV